MNRNSKVNEGSRLVGAQMTLKTVLNSGTDEQLDCYGYRINPYKKAFFYVLVVLSGGLLLLLLSWRPQLECYLKRSRTSLQKADTVLLQDQFKQFYVCSINSKHFTEGMPVDIGGQSTYNGMDEDVSSDNSMECDPTTVLTRKEPEFRYFDHQHVRYVWDLTKRQFIRLVDLSANTKCVTIQEKFHGLSQKEQSQKRLVYGDNSVDVEVKSYWRLFIEEVMNPFYIFQIGSITLWMMDEYYIYAAAILFISLVSIGVSLYETKKQSQTLHDMVSTEMTSISVCRGSVDFEDIPIRHLVPGDVISIPAHGCVMMCDAVLITGTCIVNESMLTGESVPVTKTPLTQQEDEEIYSPDIHKRHTLFCGTHILQTRYYGHAKVTAVVVRTGFRTAKGELVRGILYPKPLDFKFYRDAMKFILFLACVAAVGMTYTIIIYVKQKVHVSHIIIRVLDIITIIVPPALPAAMTVGTVYAQNRLKKSGIFCISPPRINFCGRLNLFCFDKTGTLTEDGLDMWGVIPVKSSRVCHVEHDPSNLETGPLLVCMATCHSLTMIDGELSGDPLDLIMFDSTKWLLEEPGRDTSKFDTIMPTVVKPCTKAFFLSSSDDTQPPFEVGIIRQFTFSSSLQRMSVIARTLTKDCMDIYTKGAPEKIISLCKPDTVPEDIHEVLHKYTIQGYRVIALAWKSLDPKLPWHQAQRISRDKVEHSLCFLGLMVLQNKLKPETKPVIQRLRFANIRTVMITGDMTQTAISVARNCGMVPSKDKVIIVEAHPPEGAGSARVEFKYAELPADDSGSSSGMEEFERGYKQIAIDFSNEDQRSHFAINGKSFAVLSSHFPELIPRVCVLGTVFARMSPDQKCQLIEKLQSLGYSVGMCGDGANDCEALKAAHAGISLSEAEASVAAPFTSRIPNIECVLTVMREGRAALVTSFGCFKYMALYSFIQFVSVLILYNYEANLGDLQFLYVDLVITTSIAILMGYTGAYKKLVSQRPPGSLVKLSNLISIMCQVVLVIGFQLGAFFYLQSQNWYVPVPPNKDASNTQCWETTVVFIVSTYQYITVAFCFSKGPPFRKPIYTNVPYLITLLALFAFSTWLLMFPVPAVINFLQLMHFGKKPYLFRGILLIFAVSHLILCCVLEFVITDTKLIKNLCKKCKKKTESAKYKTLQKEIVLSDWPAVGHVVYSNFDDAVNESEQGNNQREHFGLQVQ